LYLKLEELKNASVAVAESPAESLANHAVRERSLASAVENPRREAAVAAAAVVAAVAVVADLVAAAVAAVAAVAAANAVK
jgi:hypothetical protein